MRWKHKKDLAKDNSVAIVTIVDDTNYGNRLQNYALQQVIKSMGYRTETINIVSGSAIIRLKAWLIRRFYHFMFYLPSFVLEKIKESFRYRILIEERRRKNKRCFLKEIAFRRINVRYISSLEKDDNYKYFIAGSDQIWNTDFWNEPSNEWKKSYLLPFARPQKRISYAASFGKDTIDKKYIEDFRLALSEYYAISVREERAKDIVNDLLHKTIAELVLDPTLLLSAADWNEVIVRHGKELSGESGIICYFLGDISQKNSVMIHKLSEVFQCKVLFINDDLNKSVFSADALDFITCIKNAKFVVTDSFHATVFSIIFERPFIVFDRQDKAFERMNSRIETLLKLTELMNRYEPDSIENMINCDFSRASELLNKERDKSFTWLKSHLK